MSAADVPPAVSVVVPTYQRRVLVRRAVESVLAQTYRDFELIVVDDGSTDGTREALAAFGQVRYHGQENLGVGAARNAGVRLARGAVVAFLDSDDRWLPRHLAVCVELLERNPSAVLACTSPQFVIGGREAPSAARPVDALPIAIFECFGGYPSSVAIRRDALLAAGGFDERLRVYEDCDLFMRLAARGPFCLLQRRTIVHQDTRGSLVERGCANGWYLEGEELVARSALELARGLDRPDRAELERRARGRVELVRAFRSLVAGDGDAARAALLEACALVPDLDVAQEFVTRRLKKMTADERERLRLFAAAAAAWPDARSDTALFLRWNAIALAGRRGQARAAGAIAAGMPLRPLPGYAVRNRSRWWRLARRRVQRLRHRGAEPAAPCGPDYGGK